MVAFLCLKVPRKGQGSCARLREIVEGLRRRGWTVGLYPPSYADIQRSSSAVHRLLEDLWLPPAMTLK